jgi:sirohydrochlorin ferrochelatase
VAERYAFLLIDHGSRRPEANDLITEVATMVKARVASDRIVEVAHMELAEPSIAHGFSRCVERGATMVVAHPFMLAPGKHVSEDLPRLIGAAAAAHPGIKYAIAAPLGAHPGVAKAVVDRCTAALDDDAAEAS